MNRLWTLTAVLALGLLTAVGASVSCGGDDSTADDGGADEGGTRTEPNRNDGVRADFVMNMVRIGDPNAGEGFNLDGENTGPGDPLLPEDGPGGIDNQLGSLLNALIDAGLDFDPDQSIQESLDEGDLLILLSHRDIDSWTNDPGYVYLYGYAGKDGDDPEDPTDNFSGEDQLLIDPMALRNPTDPDSSLIHFEDGVLVDTTAADTSLQVGDFHAGPALFELDLQVQSDVDLHLVINGTQLVWDVETVPTGDPPLHGSIVNGMLGGYVFLGDLARAMTQLDLSGTSITEAQILDILGGQADMDVIPRGTTDTPCTAATVRTDCAPGQLCEADPARGGAEYCYEVDNLLDALSLGLVFDAVSCEITGIAPEEP